MMKNQNIINNTKSSAYSIIKPLYNTKFGELFIVSKKLNSDENILYLMKQIKVKSENEKIQILDEIKMIIKLDSKFIIKIHEYFIEQEELICLILDYSEKNKSLEELIYNSYFLTSQNIWRIFIKLLIGIYSIYKNKIVIGNLNPQNIFIDKEKNIKIGGIGNILDLSKESYERSLYKIPEIFKGESDDNKSDMWSLGCILYEMIFKERIFKDEKSMFNLNYKIPEKIDVNYVNILEKLICKYDNIVGVEKLISDSIIKKKIVEENLFSEIIKNNYEGK